MPWKTSVRLRRSEAQLREQGARSGARSRRRRRSRSGGWAPLPPDLNSSISDLIVDSSNFPEDFKSPGCRWLSEIVYQLQRDSDLPLAYIESIEC